MMNWDDMRVFLHVARQSSLSAAGKQLKMDPSTLGRRISRLEDSLSVPLFTKTPQGYDLTDAGQRMLDHAEQMELAAMSADEMGGGHSDSLSGTIRIGAPDGSANYVLPRVCARLAQENPDLEIQIVALPRVLNLSKREADLAITVSPPKVGRMTVQRITDYSLHLCGSADYLSRHPPIVSLDQVMDHPIVGYIPDLIFDKELDYLSSLGKRASPRIASNSVSVQINLINQGAGIGIVHDFVLKDFPMLRRILPDKVSLKRSFYLVRHEADIRVGRQKRIAERLISEVRRIVPELEQGD